MFAAPDGGADQHRREMEDFAKEMLGKDYVPVHLVGSGKMHENGFANMPRSMVEASRSQGNKKQNG